MSLIQLYHTNGNRESMALNLSRPLAAIRKVLTEEQSMKESDYFLNGNTRIRRSSETEIILEEVLNGGKILWIGNGASIAEGLTFTQFEKLGQEEKIAYFYQSQATHGVTFTEEGIRRSFQSMYAMSEPPLMSKEPVNTKLESNYAFSETTRNFNLMSSNKTSAALHSPYVDASAEYEQEKRKSRSDTKITEYLLSKFLIAQASFTVDPSKMIVNMEFFEDVREAVYSEQEAHQRTARLVQVLHKWGFYIPLEFAMGGALYTSDEKQITEFKQAAETKERFSAAADAAFAGWGGGLHFDTSTETGESSSHKEEFKNLKVSQIGGNPGHMEDKTDFAASLKEMATWEIVDIRKFYPSLMLLRGVRIYGKKSSLFKDALALLNENYYIQSVKTIQPYINLLEYATSVEMLISQY